MARGIAALAVVLCHTAQQDADAATANGPLLRLAGWLGPWGVTLFFVLSGFCIHLPQARKFALDERTPVAWRSFFLRRARRLLPPHYAALALAVVVGWHIHTGLLGAATLGSFAAHVLMIHPFFGYAIYYSINSVFWSIGIEVHFYLMYPLYLLLLRRVGPLFTTTALLALALVVYGCGSLFLRGDAQFIAKHTFIVTWWQWSLGAWLAHRYARRGPAIVPGLGRLWAVPCLLASLALAWFDATIFGLHPRNWILPVVCALLLAFAVRDDWSFRVRWLEKLGEASYSLYLTHPVALACVIGLARQVHYTNFLLLGTVEFGAAILFAMVFFFVVERHFLSARPAVLAPVVEAHSV